VKKKKEIVNTLENVNRKPSNHKELARRLVHMQMNLYLAKWRLLKSQNEPKIMKLEMISIKK
jgi:hypothetical protein